MTQKKIFLFGVLVCIFCIAVLFFFFLRAPRAIIDYHLFSLDIAQTPTEQEVGLAKYTTFPKNRAMYFPFATSDFYAFWMKNMHFPIDILFIEDGKIVTIYNNVPAPKNVNSPLPIYRPTTPINAVLEIDAGLAKQYGFHVGDNVIISY